MDRVITSYERPDDQEIEGIRPGKLMEYIGQTRVKANLSVFIQAAQKRGEALDHVLLYGPPGLGKTTLANIIAAEMGVSIRTTSGPAIERPGDLAALLTALEPRDVLFIDEIHRLSRTAEEVLYSAMEDNCLDIVIGKGPSARSIRLTLSPFTLIGATTRAGQLTSPLRDRFGVISRLEFYDTAQLVEIVMRSSRILKAELSADGAEEIAKRSRGTPRVANRLLKRVRDFAEFWQKEVIDAQVAAKALNQLEVDPIGLDSLDKRVILAIINQFEGGPVGLDTLAATVGEETETIEDVVEPFLLQLGFLQRTPRGRVITSQVYQHFQLPLPLSHQQELFMENN